MPDSDIKSLFAQLVAEKITDTDRARFYDLILRPENDEIFSQVLKEFREQYQNQIAAALKSGSDIEFKNAAYKETDWESLIRSILGNKMKREDNGDWGEKIDSDEKGDREMVSAFKKWRHLRYVAAAAIIAGALLFTKVLFFPKKTAAPEIISITKTIDVLPGGNKAMLTLGNGATMILDSQSNGALAQQGNTTISKINNGQIAYIIDKNPSVNPKTRNPTTGNPSAEYNTLTTPRGGQYELILPDGTKAWLNAASSITYPSSFAGTQRFVKVTGEVYFEVVHNTAMPFVIKVNDEVITDIGTSFNINAYQEEGAITTTLISGSVRISTASKTTILTPNQQSIASITGESNQIKSNVDVAKVLAWRKGLFEFNDTQLPAIMRQISRWYDVDVKFEGKKTDETFGGVISRNLPLSDILKLLESNGVHFRLENKKLYVSQ